VTVTGNTNTSEISSSGGGSIAGTVDLGSNTRTFNVSDDATNATEMRISARVISGSISKTGAGTLELSGSNNFGGGQVDVATNGGKIVGNGANSLGGVSSVTVNSGGTMLLAGGGSLDRINNNPAGQTAVNLGGGTFGIAPTGNGGNAVLEGSGSTVGIGALTLSASSTLDMGSGGVGTLTFASFNPGNFTLNITNYASTAAIGVAGVDGTDDRLIFNQDQAAAGNLDNFSFGGISAQQIALGGNFFEITPIPESSTWVAGALILATLTLAQRRRIARALMKGVKYET
jgi:hypothetical protein